MLKRIAAILAIVIVIAAGLYFARREGNGGSGAERAESDPTAIPVVQASGEIIADAVVVPAREAALSLPTGGIVAEVLVEEGAQVRAGQPLLRLEAGRLEAAVAQAEAGVAQAQGGLEQARGAVAQAEGAVSQAEAGVAQAEATVARAEASLAQVQAGPREQEVAAARAAVAAAQASLNRLENGPSQQEIAASRSAVTVAEAELARVRQGPGEAELIAARTNAEKAERALQQAQAAYDQVAGDPAISMMPQSLALEQATLDYEAAQAQYNALLEGASQADINAAQARVAQAQAQLAQVQAGARPADLDAARAEIARAQAQLDLLLAGSRPEAVTIGEAEIAAARAGVAAAQATLTSAEAGAASASAQLSTAEANVASAEAALAQAQSALAETELRAPFAGTVASLDLAVGEPVSPSTSVIRLADLSAWRIETDDLTELSVVRLAEGDPVTIRFDALPQLLLDGTVERIRTIGENKQGDITYTVLILPDGETGSLRWNMTATVTIQPDE